MMMAALVDALDVKGEKPKPIDTKNPDPIAVKNADGTLDMVKPELLKDKTPDGREVLRAESKGGRTYQMVKDGVHCHTLSFPPGVSEEEMHYWIDAHAWSPE